MTPARQGRLVFSRCVAAGSTPGWAPDDIHSSYCLALCLLLQKLMYSKGLCNPLCWWGKYNLKNLQSG